MNAGSRLVASLTGLATAAVILVAAAPAAYAVDTSRCDNTTPPTWFYPHLQDAADVAGDGVPSSWGDSYNMAKITCWESSYNQDAVNGTHYGLTQMLQSNVTAAGVSWTCYWDGGCAKDRRYHQLLAAMRYALSRYTTPAAGWQHIRDYGWW
jgi:hypothetical protein